MPLKQKSLRYAHDEGHTDVCFSSDGSKFITCGADGDIRVWTSQETTDPIHQCIGEWALSICFKDDNLYVSTGSNDIQILTFPNCERNGVLDRFVAPINQITLNDKYFAFAGEDMEVKLRNLNESEKEVIIFDGLKGPCLSTALSPNSEFLAASSGDGKLRVWNIERKELVKEVGCFPKINSFANAEILCRVDFEPKTGKYLAYLDKDKVVLLNTSDWSQFLVLSCDDVTAHYSLLKFSPCGGYIIATSVEGDLVIFNVTTGKVHEKGKHCNSTRICGVMWNPLGNGEIVYTDIEGQLGILSDCIGSEKSSIAPEEGFTEHEVDFGDIQFEDDDDDEDGENVISVEKIKKDVMGDPESELNFDANSSIAPTPRPKTPEIPLQSSFMPSSTPEHLNPRYLCWNEIGIIRSYGSLTDDDVGKSLEIEFHDSSFHNSIMLQNYQDYIFGSLSKSALVVANASQICVIPLSVSSKEWVLKLEESPEEIVLISASENLICFATNNYLVRICSIFGIQRGVISIPGPLVSMSSYQNSLLVAYHAGTVRKGDQCIRMKLIKFNGFALESREIDSALGPESTMSWLGFSDAGNPAMMDSLGMLNIYPQDCNLWVPFCDTSKHIKNPSDGFFVIAVEETYQTLRGIKCKGSVYPGFTPRPTVCELPLEPPFAEPSSEKTQLETNLFTWSNLQVKDVGKKFTETGLKSFALACRNSLDQRALELLQIVANPQLLTLSTKYAMKLNKKFLVEKLMEMAAKISDDDSFFDRSASTPDTSAMKLNKKITLSSIKRTPKSKPISREVAPPAMYQDPEESFQNHKPANTTLDSSNQEISEEPKNPFLKSSKKTEDSQLNPLSLTNKFAGVDFANENKTVEKRKQPESSIDTEKQKEKQRKLDRFMFTKRS